MASPRRDWCKVPIDILNLPFEVRGMVVSLGATFGRRWAEGATPEQLDPLHLNTAEQAQIIGTVLRSGKRVDDRWALLQRHVTSTCVSREGDVVLISWPKWLDFHGITARKSPRRERERERERESSKEDTTSPIEHLAPPEPPAWTGPDGGYETPPERDVFPTPPKEPPKPAAAGGRKRPRRDVNGPALALAEHLATSIRDGPVPGAKVPADLQPWAHELDVMLRRDPVDAETTRTVITWATAHDFWAKNILSAAKLRKQMPRLRHEMNTDTREEPDEMRRHLYSIRLPGE